MSEPPADVKRLRPPLPATAPNRARVPVELPNIVPCDAGVQRRAALDSKQSWCPDAAVDCVALADSCRCVAVNNVARKRRQRIRVSARQSQCRRSLSLSAEYRCSRRRPPSVGGWAKSALVAQTSAAQQGATHRCQLRRA